MSSTRPCGPAARLPRPGCAATAATQNRSSQPSMPQATGPGHATAPGRSTSPEALTRSCMRRRHSMAEIVAETGSPIPAFPGIGASATGAGHRRDSCQYRGRLGGTVAAGRPRVHPLREARPVQDPWSTPDGDVPPAGGRWVAFDYWQFVGPAAGAGQYQRQFSNVVEISTADPPEVLCRCWCLVER